MARDDWDDNWDKQRDEWGDEAKKPARRPAAQRQGMSTFAKVLIGVLIGAGVLGLVCCGGFAIVGWKVADQIQKGASDDPVVVRQVTADIADIDIPPEFEPVGSFKFDFLFTANMVAYQLRPRDAAAAAPEGEQVAQAEQPAEAPLEADGEEMADDLAEGAVEEEPAAENVEEPAAEGEAPPADAANEGAADDGQAADGAEAAAEGAADEPVGDGPRRRPNPNQEQLGFLGLIEIVGMTPDNLEQGQNQQLDDHMQRAGRENLRVTKTETREMTIRGKKVDVEFAEATDRQDVEMRQVSVTFPSADGTAILILQVPLDRYNEEQIVKMLESIK